MKGIYLSSKSRSKTVVKETVNGNNITVTFDDGSERTFHGIARMRPEQVGGQLPPNNNGIAVALVPKGDRIEAWYIFGEESLQGFLDYLHATAVGNSTPGAMLLEPHSNIKSMSLEDACGFNTGNN